MSLQISSPSEPMTPDVHAYLSYRQFLSDWFDAHKAKHPHFSHRAFVRRIGARSTGLVANVIAGRRNLSATMAEAVATALDLDAESTAFFLLLVEFEQAETDAIQAASWRKIAAERRFRSARRMDAAVLDVFSRWTHLATYELARVRGFRADAEWVAAHLRPAVSVEQAQEALDTLVAVGLLAPRAGSLRPTEAHLVTPHAVAGVAAFEHHHAVLERAVHALDHETADDRTFHSVTLAVPTKNLPALRRRLQQVALELMDGADGSTDPPDQVVQLLIALYPLSTPESE